MRRRRAGVHCARHLVQRPAVRHRLHPDHLQIDLHESSGRRVPRGAQFSVVSAFPAACASVRRRPPAQFVQYAASTWLRDRAPVRQVCKRYPAQLHRTGALSGSQPEERFRGNIHVVIPLPPICHLVTVDSSAAHSRLFMLAARPHTCTVSPPRFGTANCTGLLVASAPNCQPVSATTKELLASGISVHGGDTVSSVAVLAAIARSCPAPSPR